MGLGVLDEGKYLQGICVEGGAVWEMGYILVVFGCFFCTWGGVASAGADGAKLEKVSLILLIPVTHQAGNAEKKISLTWVILIR